MEANQAPNDLTRGLNTYQANVQNALAGDNTNGQPPMRTPIVPQAQGSGQTRMQNPVVHPPFRSNVSTPPM